MKTIYDVRLALWNAYQRCYQHESFAGKISEASCSVVYPKLWDFEEALTNGEAMPEEFAQPIRVNVYSYALGPSRDHEFRLAKEYRRVGHSVWESPDPIQTAIDEINRWADAYCNDVDVDEDD